MATVDSLNGHSPSIGKGTWIAPNATLVGDVVIGADCSIWYQAVLRGDVGSIEIGDQVNIQDGAVVHCTTGKSVVKLGDRVSVGHRAIVHGCTAESDVLIGMGAIVMDNAYLEKGSIVAAGAVVLENSRVRSGTIWAGVPAREVKRMDQGDAATEISKIAAGYTQYKEWYIKAGL
jgi:carbonic anhydrase/acetyltransferase-like protein (isoleucine patch superfamily)